MAIEWETQLVPENYQKKNCSFVWLTAIDLTKKTNQFDVFVNDIKRFEIISGTRTNWKIENKDGGELEFLTFSKDQHGDAHGYMMLKAPKKWISPGNPLRIKIVGQNNDENTWIIVYKAKDNITYLSNATQYETWLDVFCETQSDGYFFRIEAPEYMQGTYLQVDFGSSQSKLELKKNIGVATASIALEKTNNPHLIIQDGMSREQ